MKPDRSDDDLELEFLEQSLREGGGGAPMRDLASAVRERFESEKNQGEGEDMSALALESTVTESRSVPSFDRRTWTLLANAACIAALVFVIASFWRNGLFDGKPDSEHNATPVVQDEEDGVEDHNEAPPLVKVAGMEDVKKLQPGITALHGMGDKMTDDVLLEIIRTQPNLVHLEIRQGWITEKSVQRIPELKKLTSLSLAWNDYIGEAGWLAVTGIARLQHLNISGYMGQTGSFHNGLEDPPQPPPTGVRPGPFLVHRIASLPNLVGLDISGLRFTDEHLFQIGAKAGQNLAGLDISSTDITGRGIQSLAGWPSLVTLTAIDIGIKTPAPLQPFTLLQNLSTLHVGANGMSSVAFQTENLIKVASLPKLKSLEFRSVKFNAGQIPMMFNPDLAGVERKATINDLSFRYCFGMTDTDCEAMAQMKSLQRLSLIGIKKLGVAGLKAALRSSAQRIDIRSAFGQVGAEDFKQAFKDAEEAAAQRPGGQIVVMARNRAKKLGLEAYFIEREDGNDTYEVLLEIKKTRKVGARRR